MKKRSLKSIAEQSGYSERTLFRVLNNDPSVKASTRERIVRDLNVHGYVVENHNGPEKVVVDVSRNCPYTENLVDHIIQRLNLERYHTVKTYSGQKPNELRRELADADIVIFTEHTRLHWNAIARDINPEIFRINIFGENSENTELYISADNTGGSRAAAEYLCGRMNFKRIAAFRYMGAQDSIERINIFAGYVKLDFPDVRCDVISYYNLNTLLRFYQERGGEYDAYYYSNGYQWINLYPQLKKDDRKIFQLLFSNPEFVLSIYDDIPARLALDGYIDFETEHIWDFVAFYLRNRPLLQRHPRLITLIPINLRIEAINIRNNRKATCQQKKPLIEKDESRNEKE